MTRRWTSHVIQCKDPAACSLWDKEILNLDQWMVKNKVEPSLSKHIIQNLNSWKYQTPVTQLLPPNRILRQAILQQDRIGWKPFIEGIWSIHWRRCQTQFFKSINSPSSSLLLLSKVQRRIWRIAWEMWMHRNNYLHGDLSSLPEVEQKAINEEIVNEWNIGISTLADRHRHLFRGSLTDLLSRSYHNKRIWLASLWVAREITDINHLANNPIQADSTTRLRFDQWKRKQQTLTL